VRTRIVTAGTSSSSRDTLELVPVTRHGAAPTVIAVATFASNDFSYYDHFDWPDEIAWSAGGR
jgi:hypothetical protein